MKKVFSLLLALLIIFSLSMPAFAAEGKIDLENSKITITPAMDDWTDTDLFGKFKGVMPGDTLEQEILIRNLALNFDYVKVYMKALPHSDEEETENLPEIGISAAENFDFLSQLELKVTNGKKVIYHAVPGEDEVYPLDEADEDETYQLDEAGDLKNSVYLGKLTRSNAISSMKLLVELKVPIAMDNEFANRMGEVDWVFTFEGHNYSKDNPKTGDYIIMGAVTLMAVSGVALLALVIGKRRKRSK